MQQHSAHEEPGATGGGGVAKPVDGVERTADAGVFVVGKLQADDGGEPSTAFRFILKQIVLCIVYVCRRDAASSTDYSVCPFLGSALRLLISISCRGF